MSTATYNRGLEDVVAGPSGICYIDGDAGILAYRGQVTQALPGQPNRLVANIGDKQALGGYVKVNEWNDYEIIARGGVMMHIMNGQLMAIFIDDNKDSVNNQPGLIGFEIESEPCKISVRNIWLRSFD